MIGQNLTRKWCKYIWVYAKANKRRQSNWTYQFQLASDLAWRSLVNESRHVPITIMP